jgi:hypothetical protein
VVITFKLHAVSKATELILMVEPKASIR